MNSKLVWSFCLATWCLAQTPGVAPRVVALPVRDGHVAVLHLAPRYTSTVRMPEPVNSVAVGDPASFSAEHSEREPRLVFVKPITKQPAQSNLLITTTRGGQASLLLVSRGDAIGEGQPPIDFVLRYRQPGRFLIEPTEVPSAIVPQTVSLPAANTAPPDQAVKPTKAEEHSTLDALLARQRKAPLPVLHGEKPGVVKAGKELVKAGVSEVVDQGSEVVVLFSIVNRQEHAVELMPPQVQLAGKRKGRWATSEQLPVPDYRLSIRRIGPGGRADGVVVFTRPAFKQSNETLLLQVAESGAVDRPALAPIGFGISSLRAGVNDDVR